MRKKVSWTKSFHKIQTILTILFGTMALLVWNSTYANQEEYPVQHAFSGGAVMIGALRFPNQNITGNMIGGYGYRSFNRLLIGGEGAGVFGDHVWGGFGIFTVGYAAWMKQSLQFYPYWGFGGGQFTVNEQKQDFSFRFGLGMGMDFISPENQRGLILGVRIVYLTRFDKSTYNTIYVSFSFGGGYRR